MSASVCLKVFHIIYKVSLGDMRKAVLLTPLPGNLCVFSYKFSLVMLSSAISKKLRFQMFMKDEDFPLTPFTQIHFLKICKKVLDSKALIFRFN